MATLDPAQAIVLGITLKDAITAILIPIVAVLTTLLVQERQQTRERRMQILRALLASRHLPADPHYNASINLIPVEFNKAGKVMEAWRAYIQQVRFKPAPGNEDAHHEQSRVKQTKLIAAMMTKMGLEHSEADIQADAYASDGFVWRDNLYLDSLKAQRDAADSMKGVADALRAQLGWIMEQGGGNPPPDEPRP